jgi:hypothetical protein
MNQEQEKIAFSYANKWKKIVCCHKKVDRLWAEYIVRRSYELMEYQPPKIYFQDDTKTAITNIVLQGSYRIESDIKYRFSREIWNQVSSQLSQQSLRSIRKNNEQLYRFCHQYKLQLFAESFDRITTPLNHRQLTVLTRLRVNTVLEKAAMYGSQSDFCISALDCDYNPEKWKIFESLMSCCGLIFCLPSEDIDLKETVIVVISS